MHRRPRLRSTSTAEHRQTTGRARSRRGHRGGCAPRGLQSTSPDFCGAEGTSTSTPAAAAWRAHSPIGAECARQAALHGYTAPVPSARRSRTDRDPVRNKRFVTLLAPNRLQQAPSYVVHIRPALCIIRKIGTWEVALYRAPSAAGRGVASKTRRSALTLGDESVRLAKLALRCPPTHTHTLNSPVWMPFAI